jgi:predicted ester cyclase
MISKNKQLIGKFRAALYDCEPSTLKNQFKKVFAPDCEIHFTNPFGGLDGPGELYERVYQPLLQAIPDLERRDFILMAGGVGENNWVGCCGHYLGVFEQPWLDIPPTRHMAAFRYHEFFRVEGDRVVEMQAVWDIPQLIMQADAWPMTPSLGIEWLVPGPATNDGIIIESYDKTQSDISLQHVSEMLADMSKHPLSGGPEVMKLEHYWHPKMNWFGPSGIGSMRRIEGFRNWHQIPFLKAMPDRRGSAYSKSTLFADRNYVGGTGWPNMQLSISADGWLGIAPTNQELSMRSLDFWRIENGLIRENWVLVDLMHIYDQLGVNVFERMCEVTYARQPHT